MHHRIIGIVAVALAAAPPADAQQGRADLQYRSPMPAAVTYVSFDSTRAVMSGLPTGEMATTGHLRTVSDMTFVPADSGFQATVTLKEIEGSTSTPMGEVPMTGSNVEPLTFMISATGPRPEDLMEHTPTDGATPGDIMGAARAFSGLLNLPGRELDMGESWTDTTSMAPVIEGFQTSITTITRGTYAADTIVDGATMNVLRIETEIRMTMSGTAHGISMTQSMASTGEERVLWDSARHYVALRSGSGTSRIEMVATDMGMTMVTTVETRSITTAQVRE